MSTMDMINTGTSLSRSLIRVCMEGVSSFVHEGRWMILGSYPPFNRLTARLGHVCRTARIGGQGASSEFKGGSTTEAVHLTGPPGS